MNENDTQLKLGTRIASGLLVAANIRGDGDLDTALLRNMAEDAKKYISAFSWCGEVLQTYFAGGVGGIFAIFFIHIRPSSLAIPEWTWVFVGDIPPAYLPLSDCGSTAEAFRIYIRGMTKWVELARLGKTGIPGDGVPPVNVQATPEWADKLSQKLHGLILLVGPLFVADSSSLN